MAELENENERVAHFKTIKMSPSSSVAGRQFKGTFSWQFCCFFLIKTVLKFYLYLVHDILLEHRNKDII